MFMNFVHGVESWLPTILAVVSFVSNAMIIAFFILKFRPVNILTSRGQFWVLAKDANAQNLTNLVSALFYEGGQISVEDRKIILNRTNSLKWGLKNQAPTPAAAIISPTSNGQANVAAPVAPAN